MGNDDDRKATPDEVDRSWLSNVSAEDVAALNAEIARMRRPGWMGDVNGPGCDPDVGPDDPNANTPSPLLLHASSLGPEPTTVDEWIEQSERTGILEFPLLRAIGDDLWAAAQAALAAYAYLVDMADKSESRNGCFCLSCRLPLFKAMARLKAAVTSREPGPDAPGEKPCAP